MNASYTTEGGSSYGWVYGFQGMRLDGVTGDNLSLTREEDPTTGAWISEDLTSFKSGDDNLYRLLMDNPIAVTDPSGFGLYDDLANFVVNNSVFECS